MNEQRSQPAPMPIARLSFLPTFSGDGYGYGGGVVLTFDGTSVLFGEGSMAANLAKKVERAVNAHDKMREMLEWLDRKGGLGLDVHERIRSTLTIG